MSDHKNNTLSDLNQRINRHDERLRAVEQALAVLPRIEDKIDKLVEADHGGTIAVMREQAKARDREIKGLKEQTTSLEKTASETTEKFWKIAIVIALILGALQGLGVDLTGVIPGDTIPIEPIDQPE